MAWEPLGWTPMSFSEIDPFANAVLAHRFPKVPNLGDMTKLGSEVIDEPTDLWIAGTPCQSFSVAGKRAGLDDPRGNLTMEFLRLVGLARPRWVVWENVPGVLSIDDGLTFGSILGTLGQLGYGFAYRVLDAQYFGVPQRRRRVFVVGYLGDWRPAAAVLFERHSLSGHPAPSREKGEGIAHELAPSLAASGRGVERAGESRGQDPVIAMTLNAGGTRRPDGESETFVMQNTMIGRDAGGPEGPGWRKDGLAFTVDTKGPQAVAHSLRADGFDASEDGTGRGTPLTIAFTERGRGVGTQVESQEELSYALRDSTKGGGRLDIASGQMSVVQAVRTAQTSSNGHGIGEDEQAYTLDGANGQAQSLPMSVRRLTPTECARLQGLPDDWCAIQYRGKPAADGPQYKAYGNAMATPVGRWIGSRIYAVTRALERP